MTKEQLDQIKNTVKEKLSEQRAAYEELLAEQSKAIEERLNNLEAGENGGDALKAVEAKFEKQLENLKAEMQKAQNELAEAHEKALLEAHRINTGENAKGFFDLLEQDEKFLDTVEAAKTKTVKQTTINIDIKNDLIDSFIDTTTNVFRPMGVNETWINGIAQDPRVRPRILDIVTRRRTTADKINYLQKTGFSGFKAGIAADAPIGSTSVQVTNIVGFFEGQEIKVGGVTAKILDGGAGIDLATKTISFNTATTVALTAGVDFVYTARMAGVPYGQRKPNTDFGITKKSVDFITIAATETIPIQMYNNLSFIKGLINQEMRYALEDSLAYFIVHGNGNPGTQLSGLLSQPAIQQATWSAMPTGTDRLGAIRRAITMARLTGYKPDSILMGSELLQEIQLMKDANQLYMFANPTKCATDKIWCLNVIEDSTMMGNTAIIGNFTRALQLYDHGQMAFKTSEEHAENFVENLITMRLEMEVALVVQAPQAFVALDFDAEPA